MPPAASAGTGLPAPTPSASSLWQQYEQYTKSGADRKYYEYGTRVAGPEDFKRWLAETHPSMTGEQMIFNGYSDPTLDPFALAKLSNDFMINQANGALTTNLPGYADNRAQMADNTASMLKGEVPTDVLNNIINAGAERGILTGSYAQGGATGGGASQASWLRSLGLTSLDMKKTGGEMLSKMIADTPVPELFNPMELIGSERAARMEWELYKLKEGQNGATAAGSSLNPKAPEAYNPWKQKPNNSVGGLMQWGGGSRDAANKKYFAGGFGR